jgi:TatD DNase family protein
MLMDTHAHVQTRQFDKDRDVVIQAAFDAGIERILVPGIEIETSRMAVDLASRYPGRIFAAVGVHPHDATDFTPETLPALREMAQAPGVVAIGETGLDYYRNLSPHETQRASLTAHMELARELDLPIILHNRESHAEMIALLKAQGSGLRGVFHCFIGDQAMARDALDLGFYLSFAGPLTYPANETLRGVAAWAPEDRILVETDSPYLTPPPHRGKRNEPKQVALVAQRLAEARNVSPERIAEVTTQNAATLFHLPSASALEE